MTDYVIPCPVKTIDGKELLAAGSKYTKQTEINLIDNNAIVRVAGKMVLNGNLHKDGRNMYITDIGGTWQSTSSDDAQ